MDDEFSKLQVAGGCALVVAFFVALGFVIGFGLQLGHHIAEAIL